MLQLSQTITNRPVMSLRTGGVVATAIVPIINPNNLKIEGWWCEDYFNKSHLVLVEQDVRDIIKQGIVINDHDVLTDPEELIRLKDLLKLDFQLLNKPVETVNKKKVGKVNDFAVEMTTLHVQKLYVSQSVIRSFTGGNLSVDRNQIYEITDKKIVIKDPLQPLKARAAVPVAATQ
jgi:sporulation protein YlmC with PRC-barrel domain